MAHAVVVVGRQSIEAGNGVGGQPVEGDMCWVMGGALLLARKQWMGKLQAYPPRP